MDQHKPLSYQCLKTVIQYMDSNFRLLHSCQIPSFRNIQKVVPLRLGVLEFNNSSFTFDNVNYSYEHCRQYARDGGPVRTIHLQFDLNNDGDEEIFHDLMPGDIVIKDKHWRKGFPKTDENFSNDSYVICRVRTGLNSQYLKRQSHNGIKLRDMLRNKLYEVLGGKRIHQVEHLKIKTNHGVLRLPEGLKLKIQKLTISIVDNSRAVIDAILPILDISSFPLKSLSITLEDPEDPVIQSEILRTSEFLNIENWGFLYHHCAKLLINLPNMKIHLQNQIDVNDIVLIVRKWMEHPRVIGTRISVQTGSVEEYLNKIVKEFKVREGVLHERKCTIPYSCITLPMTSTSELNIYGKNLLYMLVMEVMPIGTSKPSKDQ